MSTTWEYKTVTVTHNGGLLKLTQKPSDAESTAALNREGASGWELVSAMCVGVSEPMTFYFKRPR